MSESHSVDRTITTFSWSELSSLGSFTSGWEEGVCGDDKLSYATVPKLKDSLELCKSLGLGVKVELKGRDVVPGVVKMVKELGMGDTVEISSFDHEQLREVNELAPELRTGALFSSPCPEDFAERALNVGASEVHLRYDTCSTVRVAEAREKGLKVMAWFRGPLSMREDSRGWNDAGNEDEDMYRIVMRSGCEEVCVNRPDVAVGVVGEIEELGGGGKLN